MVSRQVITEKVTLNNGVEMPLLGLGAYNMYGQEAKQAISDALDAGYRLIDTAAMYGNEAEIGEALRENKIPRSEIFITTKVNNADQGYASTLKAIDISLAKLQTDYVDLYLIHWPIKGKRKDTWRAFEEIYRLGKAKAIGVANYLVPFLEELKTYATVVPAVNQVEFSPYMYPGETLAYCNENGIRLQAYSPLVRGKKMSDPRLLRLAAKYQRTPAQIILRWNIELGVCPIPKSVQPERLRENINVFDFRLTPEDVEYMKTFHESYRVADDPMIFL